MGARNYELIFVEADNNTCKLDLLSNAYLALFYVAICKYFLGGVHHPKFQKMQYSTGLI